MVFPCVAVTLEEEGLTRCVRSVWMILPSKTAMKMNTRTSRRGIIVRPELLFRLLRTVELVLVVV